MISVRKIEAVNSQLRWIFCVWMEWIRWKMSKKLRAKFSDPEDIIIDSVKMKNICFYWLWMPSAFTTNKSLKGADLKQKRVVVITGHSLQITSALLTRACGISSVRCLVLFAALSDQHCLRLHVCCCCGLCFRCCPPCAACRSRFPLHVFSPQLLCQLLQDFPPSSPAAGASWIRCEHWSQPGRGCYRRLPLTTFHTAFDGVCPRHLIRDVHGPDGGLVLL